MGSFNVDQMERLRKGEGVALNEIVEEEEEDGNERVFYWGFCFGWTWAEFAFKRVFFFLVKLIGFFFREKKSAF